MIDVLTVLQVPADVELTPVGRWTGRHLKTLLLHASRQGSCPAAQAAVSCCILGWTRPCCTKAAYLGSSVSEMEISEVATTSTLISLARKMSNTCEGNALMSA